jgi:hypothetical protein
MNAYETKVSEAFMSGSRIFVIALFVFGGLSAAGQFEGNQAARTDYEKGDKARPNARYSDAAADYRSAIFLDPNFAEASQQYIFARYLELRKRPALTVWT